MDKTIARGLGRRIADCLHAKDGARSVWVLTRNSDNFAAFMAEADACHAAWGMLRTISDLIGNEDAALSWRCECYRAQAKRTAELTALTV